MIVIKIGGASGVKVGLEVKVVLVFQEIVPTPFK